jgi:hypothetical protein
MLFKLLSLLAAGKGGAVAAAAIVAGATTVSVVTTSPEVQSGLNEVVAAVSGALSPGMSKLKDGLGCGQPFVVAQRNTADKILRDGYQKEHQRLGDLRKVKPADRDAFNALMKTAEEGLRAELRTALDAVAAETLGREGHITFSEPPPADSAGDVASPSPKPKCEPKASPSPDTEGSSETTNDTTKPDVRGRAAVAERVTLTDTLAGIVEEALVDMKKIVDDAEKAVGDLETAERGKPEDKGKPESDRAKPDDKGKPTDKQGGKPSTPPGRSR